MTASEDDKHLLATHSQSPVSMAHLTGMARAGVYQAAAGAAALRALGGYVDGYGRAQFDHSAGRHTTQNAVYAAATASTALFPAEYLETLI